MTGKTWLQHFIKLLFLWGFLHFHWNEQVSMHDLFCNELMNFSKYIKNELHPSLNPRTPYTYTDKPSDAHVRRQDNGREGQSSICIYKIYIFACQ